MVSGRAEIDLQDSEKTLQLERVLNAARASDSNGMDWT